MAMISTTANPNAPDARLGLRQDVGVIGLVGLAHMVSHFCQMLLPPLFLWLKDDFSVSYAQLGFLMTVFFVVSCAVQTASGFLVDRFGPRPILFGGMVLLAVAAFGYAASSTYWMLLCCAFVAGVGNGVFHPVDYTVINRRVSSTRLGHAYSVHGICGSLGWAIAPVLLVPITLASSWRVALATAGCVALGVLTLLWLNRSSLTVPPAAEPSGDVVNSARVIAEAKSDSFGFLALPAVWLCFVFFLCYAIVISIVQAFAPEAARQLHSVPLPVAAMCLTIYMVCSAAGMVLGGFLANDSNRCELIAAAAFTVSAAVALTLGFTNVSASTVPLLFGVMGLASGISGPSRDLLVKQSTPLNATGRVYGVVYSGLDIGQAIAPLIFGVLMDRQQFSSIFVGLALVQVALIASAFSVRAARRKAV